MRKLTFKQEIYGIKMKFTIKWNEWARDEDFDKIRDDFANLIKNVKENKDREVIRKCYQPNPFQPKYHLLNLNNPPKGKK